MRVGVLASADREEVEPEALLGGGERRRVARPERLGALGGVGPERLLGPPTGLLGPATRLCLAVLVASRLGRRRCLAGIAVAERCVGLGPPAQDALRLLDASRAGEAARHRAPLDHLAAQRLALQAVGLCLAAPRQAREEEQEQQTRQHDR